MRRALLIALAALALGPASAGADPSTGSHLAAVPAVPVVYNTPCPDGLPGRGCYDETSATIYVNAPRAARIAVGIREHERGHAFDHLLLSDTERVAISAAMGWAWWRAENFADAFAACRLTEQQRDRGTLALGTPRVKLCGLLRVAALTAN